MKSKRTIFYRDPDPMFVFVASVICVAATGAAAFVAMVG